MLGNADSWTLLSVFYHSSSLHFRTSYYTAVLSHYRATETCIAQYRDYPKFCQKSVFTLQLPRTLPSYSHRHRFVLRKFQYQLVTFQLYFVPTTTVNHITQLLIQVPLCFGKTLKLASNLVANICPLHNHESHQ